LVQVLLGSAASFGLGGEQHQSQTRHVGALVPRLLLFSAKHPEALRQNVVNHESYHISNPDSLKDMSFSLAMRREVLSHRAFCVTNGEDNWKSLRTHRAGKRAPPRLIFTFSGQGAQWAQMGKELIQNVSAFKNSIEGMDAFLQTFPDPPRWKLLGM
jgi:acyl transferase domain-containing protein